MLRYSLCTFLIVLAVGCAPPQAQQGAPQGAPPPSAMTPTTVWSQGQVEEFLKQELALTTIALKSTGSHNYEGTGADAEGINYTLVVKQVLGGIKVEWKHSTGNGTITFGNPVP